MAKKKRYKADVDPRYTKEELKTIDSMVDAQKSSAKVFKPGRKRMTL